MGAGRQPDYDFFPGSGRSDAGTGPRPAADGRSLPRRPGLTAIAADAAAEPQPWTPRTRVSAPPPHVPPVFERPAPPPGDRRPWSSPARPDGAAPAAAPTSAPSTAPSTGPAGSARAGAPTRPVPAFTAFTARKASPGTSAEPGTTLAGDPVAAPGARGTMPPAPRPPSEVGAGAYAGPGGSPGPGDGRDGAPDAHGSWRPPVPLPRPDLTLGRPARRGPGRGAVLAGTLAVTVLLVTAAVVVGTPRWLAHEDRAQWAATSVRIPSKAAGLPRITTSSVTAQARSAQGDLIGDSAGQMITDLAVYGRRTGTRVVVVAGRPQHPLEAAERDLVRSGFEAAVKRSGVVLTERDAGPLGGWFGCGVHAGRTTMCLAVDAGAVVSITVTTTGPKAVQTARDVRAAVERRG